MHELIRATGDSRMQHDLIIWICALLRHQPVTVIRDMHIAAPAKLSDLCCGMHARTLPAFSKGLGILNYILESFMYTLQSDRPNHKSWMLCNTIYHTMYRQSACKPREFTKVK